MSRCAATFLHAVSIDPRQVCNIKARRFHLCGDEAASIFRRCMRGRYALALFFLPVFVSFVPSW